MHKNNLKFLTMLIILIFLVVGCSNPDGGSVDVGDGETKGNDKGKGDLLIGISFQELNNPYFISMREAFEEASESVGAEYIITDASHDVAKQVNDIDDMIQRGIDILIINPTDSDGVEPAVKAAKDAGVIVVAVDAQASGPVDTFVGSQNYDAGYLAGKKMAEDLNGKGKVAILDGIPVVPILERVEGFKKAVSENPGIEIVDTQNGKQDRAIATDVTENILQANTELAAIFSVNDGGALGALGAIEASGKDVWLYSVDGHPEVIDAILQDGVFKATSAQFPADQVRIALGMALAKYWGAKVVPTEVPIDVELQTIENAKDFSW